MKALPEPRAMDEFIHLIAQNGGKAPDAAALQTAYKDFLNGLKVGG